jgi:hypothetical protein
MSGVARTLARTAAQAILAGLVTTSLAARAWALCPNCLAQRSALTPTLELLGLFLLVPFAVAAIAIGVVRRALYRRAPSAAAASLPSAPPSSDGGDQGG